MDIALNVIQEVIESSHEKTVTDLRVSMHFLPRKKLIYDRNDFVKIYRGLVYDTGEEGW